MSMERQGLDNGLAPLVNVLVSGLVSDRSRSLCRETSSSGCQQQPMGRVCHKSLLLSCTALFIRAIAPPALSPAAVGHAFPLASVGSKYTPVKSVRSLVGCLRAYYR